MTVGSNKKFPATLKSLSMQWSPLLLVRYHDAISFPLTLFHQQEHLVFLTRLLNLIFKGPHLGLNVINWRRNCFYVWKRSPRVWTFSSSRERESPGSAPPSSPHCTPSNQRLWLHAYWSGSHRPRGHVVLVAYSHDGHLQVDDLQGKNFPVCIVHLVHLITFEERIVFFAISANQVSKALLHLWVAALSKQFQHSVARAVHLKFN